MSDLAGFLLARISEDEDTARTRLGPGALSHSFVWQSQQHRVLAECEAKRRIVAEHDVKPYATSECQTCADGDTWEGDSGWHVVGAAHPCLTLRLLALPYADHPEYDESWRP